MPPWMVLVIGAVVMLAVLVTALLLRPRVQRRLHPGVDVEGWRRTSVTLPWKDRWELYRANATGRATSPRLAGLAVRRGEWAVGTTESMLTARSTARRVLLGVCGALTVIGLLQLVLLVVGGSSVAAWLNLAPLVSGPLLAYASFGPPQRRYLEKFRRSIEANRRLVDGPST